MSSRNVKIRPEDVAACQEILGYLNFSGGRPDPAFQKLVNSLLTRLGWSQFWQVLRDQLNRLHESTPAFADITQSKGIIEFVESHAIEGYLEFHRDLLFTVTVEDLRQPFFVTRMIEVLLQLGGPWDQSKRLLQGMLHHLNDYLGYRPIAVLENGRRAEPYPHERTRPVPVYLRGAGVANGPYQAIVSQALELIRETTGDLLAGVYFDLELLDELAVDYRPYDHLHPVNKRTNYLFGEWDPQFLDNSGRYRRFVIRRLILDSLVSWCNEQKRVPVAERIFDAGAVLAGTILMASAVSGSSPQTHDSTVSLVTLLPRIARQRDEFYNQLMKRTVGARKTRLARALKKTQQPFGHVRQSLNMALADYGARQMQRRFLAMISSRMGYPDESRRHSSVIPCASARIECEISWRLKSCEKSLLKGDGEAASILIEEAEDLFHRGINCGAVMDPWNILGFQGQFPLFHSIEDAVPDARADVLTGIVEGLLRSYSLALIDAAARNQAALYQSLDRRFEAIAEFWDRFATNAVAEFATVQGRAMLDSARQVASVLAEWRSAGEESGKLSFWKSRVAMFNSAHSYGRVVTALLERKDLVATMGLLIQWLSDAPEVGFHSAQSNFMDAMSQWMDLVIRADNPAPRKERWSLIRKMFDYLEANAGIYWNAPKISGLRDVLDDHKKDPGDRSESGPSDDSDEDDLFSAAYDDMTYRASNDDSHEGETIDGGARRPGQTEIERWEHTIEWHLSFLRLLTMLWQQAASLAVTMDPADAEPQFPLADVARNWLTQIRRIRKEVSEFVVAVGEIEIDAPMGDHDSNVEFDMQMQSKHFIVQTAILIAIQARLAEFEVCALLPGDEQPAGDAALDHKIAEMVRALMLRDVEHVRKSLPGLLRALQRQPLLYVPLEHGGRPLDILQVRMTQTVVRFLLAQLPRAGLLRESWHLLNTAQRMERTARPEGMAVTEFDRLFKIAIRNVMDVIVTASAGWSSGRFSDEDLIEVVGEVIEHFLGQWLEHSSSMRLSTIEALNYDYWWERVNPFVKAYGGELLNASVLTLGNLRTILHQGVGRYLDHLEENEDPLHPMKLLEDIRNDVISLDDAVESLELIYQITVEKFDRFLEYNTTTTQSDYGEMFFSWLEFLRLEVAYDRNSWNLIPVTIAHEILSRKNRVVAAQIWEDVFATRTEEMADLHLADLRDLEREHGMRLPSVTNRLQERFVKPLAVNYMLAAVPRAIEDAEAERPSPAMEFLSNSIEDYLGTSSGSGIEIPAWLRQIEEEIDRHFKTVDRFSIDYEIDLQLSTILPPLREMKSQLRQWTSPLKTPKTRP